MSYLIREPADPAIAAMAGHARAHLMDEIVPFWFPRAIDRAYGGFFTCFDNRGRFISDAKYTWSQGRFVAVCCSLAEAARHGSLPLDEEALLVAAKRGAEFVRDHAVLPGYTTRYVVDRRGGADGQPTRSLYADSFAAMGFAALARATGEVAWYELADQIRRNAWRTASLSEIPTAPYQMPANTRPFGVSMILLNVELDMAAARAVLGMSAEVADLQRASAGVLSFADLDLSFMEVVGDHLDRSSLLARHRTPGHGLEGIWMLAVAAGEADSGATRDLVERAVALCELGWDPVHGGLLRYTDATGGRPAGRLLGLPYEELVTSTWDTKLWWVHSEAAWTTALLAHWSGDQRLRCWRDRIWEYTRTTFPGRDEGAEWIQIRDRSGHPLDQVVALPLKDPYHLIRNLLQIMELGQTSRSADALHNAPEGKL
jgi:N-acylglucosamine 2-epimerase